MALDTASGSYIIEATVQGESCSIRGVGSANTSGTSCNGQLSIHQESGPAECREPQSHWYQPGRNLGKRAISSAVEHCLHTAGVASSNLASPTIKSITYAILFPSPHLRFATLARQLGRKTWRPSLHDRGGMAGGSGKCWYADGDIHSGLRRSTRRPTRRPGRLPLSRRSHAEY